MPSPFPGMDPYLETNPVFHELHTQMLAEMQRQLQPQLRPRYVARLESLSEEELALRKQRRIVIYVRAKPRLAVASIELLSPSNKDRGSISQKRYLEKRASALRSGLHWIELDLLRAGDRPFVPAQPPTPATYECYVAQATPTGWNHLVYGWGLRDPLPCIPLPLLGDDQAVIDVKLCFDTVHDAIADDDEAGYDGDPPPPRLSDTDRAWVKSVLASRSPSA